MTRQLHEPGIDVLIDCGTNDKLEYIIYKTVELIAKQNQAGRLHTFTQRVVEHLLIELEEIKEINKGEQKQ